MNCSRVRWLALATSKAGFHHDAVIEWNRGACDTIRHNHERGVVSWPLTQCDVHEFDFRDFEGAALVSGGPPCQPFSIGGKHAGHRDRRNLFPEAVRAVREIRPKAILIENVKGLLRQSFARFFEYVVLQLTYPDLVARPDEEWTKHLDRLEQHHTRGKMTGLNYHVVFRRLNAADYGVPQRRERVFIVGFRSDLGIEWSFPEPTHSQEGLLHSQWVTGDYWERHEVSARNRPKPPASQARRIRGLESPRFWPELQPWRTVRDAISDLPPPSMKGRSDFNHELNPGAKAYGGHTGSPIDEPAKTLKAGDHGVPGGENMVVLPNGDVRYFTVRESARLQTFPDEFRFPGSWTESMRQLGNAVPVDLATVIAGTIAQSLRGGIGDG
ncbi:MAG: DNA cytosine methyltransferase [Planctomycetaceae bacterium]